MDNTDERIPSKRLHDIKALLTDHGYVIIMTTCMDILSSHLYIIVFPWMENFSIVDVEIKSVSELRQVWKHIFSLQMFSRCRSLWFFGSGMLSVLTGSSLLRTSRSLSALQRSQLGVTDARLSGASLLQSVRSLGDQDICLCLSSDWNLTIFMEKNRNVDKQRIIQIISRHVQSRRHVSLGRSDSRMNTRRMTVMTVGLTTFTHKQTLTTRDRLDDRTRRYSIATVVTMCFAHNDRYVFNQ